MHCTAPLIGALSALALVDASKLSLRLKQRDNANIASALAGAVKLNNAVAYGICDVSYQVFAAVAAIKPGSMNTYVLTADCKALGYIVYTTASSTSTATPTSNSFSINTVPLTSISSSPSISYSYSSLPSAVSTTAPLVVKGTYYGGNLPICTGGFIRDPAGGGGCVQCADQTC